LISLLVSNCSSSLNTEINDDSENQSVSGININDLDYEELSPEETAGLIFMREEEKLARDVYNALYAK